MYFQTLVLLCVVGVKDTVVIECNVNRRGWIEALSISSSLFFIVPGVCFDLAVFFFCSFFSFLFFRLLRKHKRRREEGIVNSWLYHHYKCISNPIQTTPQLIFGNTTYLFLQVILFFFHSFPLLSPLRITSQFTLSLSYLIKTTQDNPATSNVRR